MKFDYHKLLLISIVASIQFGNLFSQDQNPTQLLNEMISAIRSIKTVQFSIVQTERYKGILNTQVDAVKMQIHPLKIYISAESPGKSYEVLWLAGENYGDAWVHPGAFPFFTLNLNPEGNTMKIGHHSIFALNLNYLADLMADVMKKDGKNFEKVAHYQGLFDVGGRLCYKIDLDFPTFKLLPYIIKPGEDLVKVAERFHVSEYMIFERNADIKNYTDVKAGQTIKVPERYAKNIVLFIDKELKLPIIEMMYDDLGLFERYEFKKLIMNPNFPNTEFTKAHSEYHF
jgi:hypothetical protein